MKQEITQYYNDLATDYDKNRFANSYGKYIHLQETQILDKYITLNDISKNLDIACGTGRFLNYADYGIDISSEMVGVSQKKFPNKNITVGDIENLPFEKATFKNVLSFHLLMHLEVQQLDGIFKEVSRVTKKGGLFIFDIPSKKRRQLTGYRSTSWHGGNQINLKEIKELIKENWELISYHGVAFFPIHLIHSNVRKYITPLDNLLCNSVFKEVSSHIIYVIKRK